MHEPALPRALDPPWIEPTRLGLRSLAAAATNVLRAPLAHRALLVSCVWRELQGRFRGSVIGVLWPVLRVLALAAAYRAVFARSPAQTGAASVEWILVGAFAWTAFAESLARATPALVERAGLIRKLAYPCELLPLVPVLIETALFALAAAACALVAWLTPLPGPGGNLVLLLAVVPLQIGLSWGLALGLSALQVFVRDTAHALALASTALLFLTPVFWSPLDGIPRAAWVEWNPLHHLLALWRAAWLGPEWAGLGADGIAAALESLAAAALLALLSGAALFAATRARFADEV